MKKLILASASPRRSALLSQAGFSFEIIPANVVENKPVFAPPKTLTCYNAELKARDIANSFPYDLVLGADTCVAAEKNFILNKPESMKEAIAMLKFLSGKTHDVWTGVCFCCHEWNLYETHAYKSKVRFKTLDEATILRYFERVNPLDKAGAYGIQEGRELIIESYEEPISNIIGLPVELFAPRLRELLNKD